MTFAIGILAIMLALICALAYASVDEMMRQEAQNEFNRETTDV
jgi:hypothetical protein